MKHVSILVPQHAVLAAVEDPRYMLTMVNGFLQEGGHPPLFDIHLVGATRQVELHDSRFTVNVDRLIDDVGKTDLVFVPAITGNLHEAIEANRALYPWIVNQYRNGAEVASLCIGAFLLASTGLLDNKQCSSHWHTANDFRTMFPDVTLVDDRIITEDHGLYTSGGANSYWNLLLYLVERYTDRKTAITAAKVFAIDIDRTSQSHFIMFRGQTRHGDEHVRKAQDFIEENYQERLTVDQLADLVAIGRRSFERRFKNATRNTVNEYIQRVKIEVAKKQLEQGSKQVTEVMYDVGYSDTKAFRQIFKKITGLTPVDYRNKYSRQHP